MVKIYKHLKEIINNQKLLFISNYWRIIMEAFKIKLKYFIMCYPQTDKQTKKTN